MGTSPAPSAGRTGFPSSRSMTPMPRTHAYPWKRARWYPSVQVNAIEPTATQAKALGSTLACDIMRMPGAGRWQLTHDPTGCETALLQPSQCAPKTS